MVGPWSALLALASTSQAALVNFSLTGDVDFWADSPNDYGLDMGDTISVSGTFDDSALTGGTGTISFGSGSGNTLTIMAGSMTFSETDDNQFASGYPRLSLLAGGFDGLNYTADFGTISYFGSLGMAFDAYDEADNWVSGTWDAASFSMSAVPVPAAIWLFGSGVLGLVGMARRRQTA